MYDDAPRSHEVDQIPYPPARTFPPQPIDPTDTTANSGVGSIVIRRSHVPPPPLPEPTPEATPEEDETPPPPPPPTL